MNKERIYSKMHELEAIIGHKFSNIELLCKAMCVEKLVLAGVGKNHAEYRNEALAIVGDALLKFVIVDNLYSIRKGEIKKGDVTFEKSNIEKNKTIHNVTLKYRIIDYAYNDKHFYSDENIPEHEKVLCKEHDPYIEAIIGAIFYDSDFENVKEWILNWLLPKLENSAE